MTIQYPVNAPVFDITVDLTPGTVAIVSLPAPASLDWAPDEVRNNAVHVFAEDAFGVYMVNLRDFRSDAALALPIAALGTAYVVIDYGTTFAPVLPEVNSTNQFLAYAVEDSTTVTIVPVADLTGGHPAGVPFDVLLNRGEGYYAESVSPFPNLTGTTVSSSRPFGLTNGNKCTFIPEGNPFCDHIFEVAQPVQTWGMQVFVGSLPNQPDGTVYRIVASEDGTTVSQDGTAIGTIDLGEFIEVGPSPFIHIFSADKPIFVTQYMIGVDPGIGDPSMGNVIPPEQYLSSYVFSTVGGSQFSEHFITVIAEDADLATIELDEVPIGAGNFTSIPGSGFSGVHLSISEGVHCTSSNGVHGITVHGYNLDDSYLYPGGVSFSVPCPGDANGDGTVDPLDSGFVLARFGCSYPEDGENCLNADVNGDEAVDPLDSGFVLARFGPCP
ncbi:MAG: hypothetical protein IID37_14060 [Planctomycetes bacterium]|nr:hypothetical protein [Planctomycetota bacterium]